MFDDEVEFAMAESRELAHDEILDFQADLWGDPALRGDLG